MNAPEDTGRISWNITQEQEEENNRRIAAEAEHCRRKIEKFQPLWKRCLFGHTMKEVEPMMAVLSEKDRRDAFPEVLEGHYPKNCSRACKSAPPHAGRTGTAAR